MLGLTWRITPLSFAEVVRSRRLLRSRCFACVTRPDGCDLSAAIRPAPLFLYCYPLRVWSFWGSFFPSVNGSAERRCRGDPSKGFERGYSTAQSSAHLSFSRPTFPTGRRDL